MHDAGFFHMGDGKVYVIDTAAETLAEQVKGTFNVSLIGNIAQSPKRGEIYATETFHSRGSRGDRLDVLTIFDRQTLAPKGEVILPDRQALHGHAAALCRCCRWTTTAGWASPISARRPRSPWWTSTPARSSGRYRPRSVCWPIPPASGASAPCAPTVAFSARNWRRTAAWPGRPAPTSFFNSDTSPIFERPAVIGGTAYFPTIAGLVYPVDISGSVAKVGEAWNLVPESERAQKWAPAGIGLIDRDDQGRFYIIMHPDAVDGSYQGGGPEVWVFDAAAKKRVQRIALKSWGLSLAVSRGENPVLMVVNPADMSLEMYDTGSGEFIRTISGFGQETPLMVHGSK